MSSLSRYGTPTSKATTDAAGCWIDGHWGQYGTSRLLDIAAAHGFTPNDDRDRLLMDYATALVHDAGMDSNASEDVLAKLLPNSDDPYGDEWQVREELTSLADDAVAWLNEYVAPDGYSFDWQDGELFLLSDDAWCDWQVC